MVRRSRRNRGGRRRGSSRMSSTSVRRTVRSQMFGPRERVAPRRVIRTGRGHGTLSWNTLRRLSLFPRKVDGANNEDVWWVTALKWVGSIVMQLITIALTEEALEQRALKSNLSYKPRAGSVVVGSVQSMIFGPSDFVASSPLADPTSNIKFQSIKFRQGRIMHARFTLVPQATMTSRGGSVAMALIPVTIGENIDISKANDEQEKWTFDDVCRLPRAVVKSATTATSVVYSPSPGDLAYRYLEMGYPNFQTTLQTMQDYCIRLVVAYTDMSSNTRDTSAEYSLTEAMFELIIDGRVEIREISDRREIATTPLSTRPPNTVLRCSYDARELVELDNCEYKDGVLFELPIDDISMISTPGSAETCE